MTNKENPRIPGTLAFNILLGFTLLLCGTAPGFAAGNLAAPEGMTDIEIQNVITLVARHHIRTLMDGDYVAAESIDTAKNAKPPEGIAWNYPWGVALYGMLRSTDVTKDKDVDQFVIKHNAICARYFEWQTKLKATVTNTSELPAFEGGTKIKGLMLLGSLDSCGAMGTQIIEELTRHPEQDSPQIEAVLARIADWVVKRQDRLPDGTLWRPKAMGGTVWPDDLYMGGVFLARYGSYTHDPKLVEDAANQIIHQAALEQDADGLWFHGYFQNEKKHAPFKWGRGNGWVMLTLVETLSVLPENDSLRPALLDILRRQVNGLKQVQAPDGMWRQVLDRPDLWEETSCTAMFSYGIARAADRGWIDATNMTVARHAFAGLTKNIGPDGSIKGTCQGTSIGLNLDYYRNRQQPDDDPHGIGPVLLAGTEILPAKKSGP
jgi:rhamnogalacturonyl hydrolase YesR